MKKNSIVLCLLIIILTNAYPCTQDPTAIINNSDKFVLDCRIIPRSSVEISYWFRYLTHYPQYKPKGFNGQALLSWFGPVNDNQSKNLVDQDCNYFAVEASIQLNNELLEQTGEFVFKIVSIGEVNLQIPSDPIIKNYEIDYTLLLEGRWFYYYQFQGVNYNKIFLWSSVTKQLEIAYKIRDLNIQVKRQIIIGGKQKVGSIEFEAFQGNFYDFDVKKGYKMLNQDQIVAKVNGVQPQVEYISHLWGPIEKIQDPKDQILNQTIFLDQTLTCSTSRIQFRYKAKSDPVQFIKQIVFVVVLGIVSTESLSDQEKIFYDYYFYIENQQLHFETYSYTDINNQIQFITEKHLIKIVKDGEYEISAQYDFLKKKIIVAVITQKEIFIVKEIGQIYHYLNMKKTLFLRKQFLQEQIETRGDEVNEVIYEISDQPFPRPLTPECQKYKIINLLEQNLFKSSIDDRNCSQLITDCTKCKYDHNIRVICSECSDKTYFFQNSSMKCVKCQLHLHECNGCKSDQYYSNLTGCTSDCGPNLFGNRTSKFCVPLLDLETLSDPLQIQSEDDSVDEQNQQNDTNETSNNSDKNPTKCTSKCILCNQQLQCLQCEPKFFLDFKANMCKQECLPNQYTNHFSSTCEPCNSLTCPQTQCPEFQYQTNEGCFDCPNSCARCVNNHTCLKCKTSFFMVEDQCIKECPLNYYSDYSYHKCPAVPPSLDSKKSDPYFYSLINIGKNTELCSEGQLIQITFLDEDPIIIEYFYYGINLINQQNDAQIYPPLQNKDYQIALKQNQSKIQICISTNLTLFQNQNFMLKIQNNKVKTIITFNPPISTFLILSTLDDTKSKQITAINDQLYSNRASTYSLQLIYSFIFRNSLKSIGVIGLLTNIFQALGLPLLQRKVMPPQSYEMIRLFTQFIQLDTLPEFYDQQKEEYVAFFVINVTEEVLALNYNSTAQQLGLQPIILYTIWNIHILLALFFLALLLRWLTHKNAIEQKWKEFKRDSVWNYLEMFIESSLITIIVCLIICFQYIKQLFQIGQNLFNQFLQSILGIFSVILCFLYSIGLIILWTRNTYILYQYSLKREEYKRLGDLEEIQKFEEYVSASYNLQLGNTNQDSLLGIMLYQINLVKKIILIFINMFLTEYPFEQNILSAQIVIVFLMFSFQLNVQKLKMYQFIQYFARVAILNCFEQILLILLFSSIALCAYKYNSLQFAIEQETTEIEIYIEQWQSCGNLVNYLIIQTILISSVKAITLIIWSIKNFLKKNEQAQQQGQNSPVVIKSNQQAENNSQKIKEIELSVSQVQEKRKSIQPQQIPKQETFFQNQVLQFYQDQDYRPKVEQKLESRPTQQINHNVINQFNIGTHRVDGQAIKRQTVFKNRQGSMPLHYPPGKNPYMRQDDQE